MLRQPCSFTVRIVEVVWLEMFPFPIGSNGAEIEGKCSIVGNQSRPREPVIEKNITAASWQVLRWTDRSVE